MLESPRVQLVPDGLERDDGLGRWRPVIAAAPDAASRPVIAPTAPGSEAQTLRRWTGEGRAAGLAGVFYDNRDGGHSRLNPLRFPQLTYITYGEGLPGAPESHRSLAHQFLFPGPVLGNASLAITRGPAQRSLPRLAMTSAWAVRQAALNYEHNHLYVYPGHRDVRDGRDILPAMLPYFVISYGSSRSDQPLVETLALSLASLTPATRQRLEQERLLAPTLVMLLRRSMQGVTDYLAPHAHPGALHRRNMRPGLAMAMAQALTPETIPPMVRLRVLEDSFAASAGLSRRSEALFDSPGAIARLWRGWEGRHEMTLSAASTRDPNDRALQFHWVVVSGDPQKVRVTPLDDAARRVQLQVDWHDTPFVPWSGAQSRSRVEIAVIAWNGVHYSAPAFVTVAFPTHEHRVYAPGPDGAPQLVSIDYDAAGRDVPFDPQLWWTASWTDEAIRDDLGRVIGWRRIGRDGTERVVTPADGGTGYNLTRNNAGVPILQDLSTP
ncbi:MAG: hypothetical protein ACXIU8_12855 [Alkalilacustris sp.]